MEYDSYAKKTELSNNGAWICYTLGAGLIVGSIYSQTFLMFSFLGVIITGVVSTLTGF